MIYVLLADGFEETEALAPLDVMRRYGIDAALAGVGGREICGAHSIRVMTDMCAEDIDVDDVDGVILPGGMPGTLNLQNSTCVTALINYCAENSLLIAAICAAPSILGDMGLLSGREAVCFPGFEERLTGAALSEKPVVASGNIITAKGAGAALEFGAEIVDYVSGKAGAGREILLQMQCSL